MTDMENVMLKRAIEDRRKAIEERDRLRVAAQEVIDSGPAHDADYWGLRGHPTITGADCQQMAWARDTLRAALTDPKETE